MECQPSNVQLWSIMDSIHLGSIEEKVVQLAGRANDVATCVGRQDQDEEA